MRLTNIVGACLGQTTVDRAQYEVSKVAVEPHGGDRFVPGPGSARAVDPVTATLAAIEAGPAAEFREFASNLALRPEQQWPERLAAPPPRYTQTLALSEPALRKNAPFGLSAECWSSDRKGDVADRLRARFQEAAPGGDVCTALTLERHGPKLALCAEFETSGRHHLLRDIPPNEVPDRLREVSAAIEQIPRRALADFMQNEIYDWNDDQGRSTGTGLGKTKRETVQIRSDPGEGRVFEIRRKHVPSVDVPFGLPGVCWSLPKQAGTMFLERLQREFPRKAKRYSRATFLAASGRLYLTVAKPQTIR